MFKEVNIKKLNILMVISEGKEWVIFKDEVKIFSNVYYYILLWE